MNTIDSNVQVEPKQIVDACLWLHLNVDHTTVIDPSWWDYLFNTGPTLKYLLIATQCDNYEDVLEKHEGKRIVHLITESLEKLADYEG